MKKVLDTLGSIRLAITLLIILTFVSIFGVVIPQGLHPQLYIQKWGDILGKGFVFTGIDHIFSTWWFYSLLILLSVNILVCSVSRLLKNIKGSLEPRFINSPEKIKSIKHSSTFTIPKSTESTLTAVTRTLKKNFYLVRNNGKDGTIQIHAFRGISKDLGSLIFHLSLVALLFGGLIGKIGGYSYLQELKTGESSPVRDRPFLLRNDWFKLEVNDKGEIKDFKSKLLLLNPDSSIITSKVIEVNSPLSYEGIRFYQTSYGKEMDGAEELSLQVIGPEFEPGVHNGAFELNKPQQLKGLTIQISQFLTDFVVDMDSRKAVSKSREHNNPAAHVVISKGADTLYKHWVFLNHPGIHAPDGPYKVFLTNYKPAYFTGIQVRKNPGVPTIWTGIILMTLGLYFVFYVSKRNLWVILVKKEDSLTEISLGGSSSQADFKNEFSKICNQLKQIS